MELCTTLGIHKAQENIAPSELLILRASDAFVKNYYASFVVKDEVFQWFCIFVSTQISNKVKHSQAQCSYAAANR